MHAFRPSPVHNNPTQGVAEGALVQVPGHGPLRLPRQLSLFGKLLDEINGEFFTFTPDTLLRVLSGTKFITLIAKQDRVGHLAFLKIAYGAAGKHKLTPRSRATIHKILVPALSAAFVDQLIASEPVALTRESAWTMVVRCLDGKRNVIASIATCLSACDEHVIQVLGPLFLREGKAAAGRAINVLLGDSTNAWAVAFPLVPQLIAVQVEVALKTLAWVEMQSDPPSAGRDRQKSSIDSLLDSKKRPMGQWLDEVRKQSGCSNLFELHDKLAQRAARPEHAPTHELLRTWSSCRRTVIPPSAVPRLLAALQCPDEAWEVRFYVARFLTFLIDLVLASMPAGTAAWQDVQKHIQGRLAAAYLAQLAIEPALA